MRNNHGQECVHEKTSGIKETLEILVNKGRAYVVWEKYICTNM